MKRYMLPALLMLVLVVPCRAAEDGIQPPASRSMIQHADGGYRFLCNGEPMEIRGALATGAFQALAETGANCVLLPDPHAAAEGLTQAQAAGLMAAIRLPLKDGTVAERTKQGEQLLAVVRKYKEHPAFLMWVIEGSAAASGKEDTNAYAAVNDLARLIHREDPVHVVASDVGLLDGAPVKAELSAKYCPEVDLLGCAMGCTVTNLTLPLEGTGWTKPFILIGCGRPGPLPEKRASWGAPLDVPTADRLVWMVDRLTVVLNEAAGQCLGSILFSWDAPSSARSVWACARLADGTTSEWVDAMTYAWLGRNPTNRCPLIQAVNSPVKARIAMPGTVEQAGVTAEDPENDELSYTWSLVREFSAKDVDGLPSSRFDPVPSAFSDKSKPRIAFKLPEDAGTYRLLVFASDGKGHTTESGIPFLVQSVRKAAGMATNTPPSGAAGSTNRVETPAPKPVVATGSEKALYVTVEQTTQGNGWQLMVDGQPFFVKGAGGRKGLEELQAAGANAIRTWSTDMVDPVLDAAQKHGLKVCLGLWMKQERHGFDYTHRVAVEAQLKRLRAAVRRYKDHPALLMWCCGIEVEWGEGTNVAVYEAINEMAGMVHQEDTNHPTTTAFADLGENNIKAALAAQYCPELDIFGVNSYGGLNTMADRLREVGWTRPYMIMEFGPKGQWEVPKTAWGAEVEQMPMEKAKFYEESYNRSISSQENWCLGSFVFSWDYKMECTPTWYSMHLADGKRMNTADTMWRAWSHREPTNRCPEITWVGSPLDRAKVPPGKNYILDVNVTDPDGDPLTFQWVLMKEIKRTTPDTTVSTELKPYPGRIKADQQIKATITTPPTPGAYRVFIYVYDGKGNAGSANMPFYVKEPNT